jgi:P27 family predicted phage terminase small subunit
MKRRIPTELTGDALLAWDTFRGKDVEEIDRPAMVMLCQAWAEMLSAEKQIEKNGTVIKLPNNYPGGNPYLKVRDTARTTVIRLLREFGYTPQSRAKIVDKAAHEEPSDLEF